MEKKRDYTGQQFGNRLIIRNECIPEDWTSIGKPIPQNYKHYRLSECLNCHAHIPCEVNKIEKSKPKRCSFCSNIGNYFNLNTTNNSWRIERNTAYCDVIFHDETITFCIDKSQYDIACQYSWRIAKKRNKYYVVAGSYKKGTMIYIHQLVYGNVSKGLEIDHIDGDSLNNRISNLRAVTHVANVDNMKKVRIDNQYGMRGISYDKKNGKYKVDYSYHNTRIYVKPWKTIEEAVYCRQCLEKEFGFTLIEDNDIAKHYELCNPILRKNIEEYVRSKVSSKLILNNNQEASA